MGRIRAYTVKRGLLALAILGFTCGDAGADILALSSFDSGPDGWTSNTPSQITWQSTGGNPGGFMQFSDSSSVASVLIAPSTFLGDFISNGITSISYDDDIISETGVVSVSPPKVELSGPGGSALFIGGHVSTTYTTGWMTVTAAISDTTIPPNGWIINSGTWLGLLADVTELQIPIERVTNEVVPGDTDVEGIDNVTLSGSIAAVPEPGSVAIFGSCFILGATFLRRNCYGKRAVSSDLL